MVDNQKQNQDVAQDEQREAQDNLNATMMSIDVSDLDLRGADTKTEIKIEMPSDDDIIQEQLEKKKSPVSRLVSKVFKKKDPVAMPQRKERSGMLKVYQNVWVSEPESSFLSQLYFYTSRLLIVGISVFLHYVLFEHFLQALQGDHPAKLVFIVLLAIDVLMIAFSLLLKASPGWLVAMPVSVYAVFFAYLALFFHTADPFIFSVKELTVSQLLNSFYLSTLVYVFVICVFEVGERILGKLFLGFVSLLSFVPMLFGHFYKVDLEQLFFENVFFIEIPSYYLQPLFLSFHVIIPFLFVVFLLMSLLPVTSQRQRARRGFVRSLCWLTLALIIANFALMQKNRVFHIANMFVPQKLGVGGVETEMLNHDIRVETKNFNLQAGKDQKARYHFSLNKGKKINQFLLQVVDKYDYPVRSLNQSDIVVYNDEKKVKRFSFVEEPNLDPKRGNYIISFDIEEKEPLLSWDKSQTNFTNEGQIIFKLADLTKVKRMVIKYADESLLDVTNPKREDIHLPLNYFDIGDYNLEIDLFDRMNQVVFQDKFLISIQTKPEFSLLLPEKKDVVNKFLSVLIMPKGLTLKDIESVTYKLDQDIVFVSTEDFYYHTIDISKLLAGEHLLTVVLKHQNKEIKKEVQFFKSSLVPQLVITEPAMGSFALKTAKVSFELKKAGNRKIAGLKLFVNGDVFSDIEIDKQSLTLPVSRWLQSELYLTIQATLDDGTKVSDWLQINKGLSLLDVQFKQDTLKFLNYRNIAVILDGSISSLDNWQGREKWRVMRKAVLDKEIDERIKNLDPTYILFGSDKSHYYKDCDDEQVLIKQNKYNRSFLKRQLSKKSPNGVSAIVAALKKAYKLNPDKIFLFADNADTCTTSFSSIRKLVKKSPQTQIVIFVLGQVVESSKQWLEKLAEMTNGRLYQPENYEILKKSLLSEMVLSYEVYSQGELVAREPLGQKKFYLVPGSYTLKIPYGNDMEQLDFNLDNNSGTTLEISGDKGKIHVKEIKANM